MIFGKKAARFMAARTSRRFLARDPLAPMLVKLWADLREHMAGNPSKVGEARSCAFDMEIWRQRPQGRPSSDRKDE